MSSSNETTNPVPAEEAAAASKPSKLQTPPQFVADYISYTKIKHVEKFRMKNPDKNREYWLGRVEEWRKFARDNPKTHSQWLGNASTVEEWTNVNFPETEIKMVVEKTDPEVNVPAEEAAAASKPSKTKTPQQFVGDFRSFTKAKDFKRMRKELPGKNRSYWLNCVKDWRAFANENPQTHSKWLGRASRLSKWTDIYFPENGVGPDRYETTDDSNPSSGSAAAKTDAPSSGATSSKVPAENFENDSDDDDTDVEIDLDLAYKEFKSLQDLTVEQLVTHIKRREGKGSLCTSREWEEVEEKRKNTFLFLFFKV